MWYDISMEDPKLDICSIAYEVIKQRFESKTKLKLACFSLCNGFLEVKASNGTWPLLYKIGKDMQLVYDAKLTNEKHAGVLSKKQAIGILLSWNEDGNIAVYMNVKGMICILHAGETLESLAIEHDLAGV